MKRWAILTVLIYLLGLIALTVPIILICFGAWWLGPEQGVGLKVALEAYEEVGYWIWLLFMGAGALILLLPVGTTRQRLIPRRPLMAPVITTSLFLALLFLSGGLSLSCAIFKDKAFEVFALCGELAWTDAAQVLFRNLLLKSSASVTPATLDYYLGAATLTTTLWFIWAMIFYLFARRDDPSRLAKRMTRWLLRGSVLELLVAVPSHIIVRNRHDCCAPLGTFWGITTGLSVMLLCFGPGVFFLFLERFGRLQPGPADPQVPVSPS